MSEAVIALREIRGRNGGTAFSVLKSLFCSNANYPRPDCGPGVRLIWEGQTEPGGVVVDAPHVLALRATGAIQVGDSQLYGDHLT
jgi:hypothetical protein